MEWTHTWMLKLVYSPQRDKSTEASQLNRTTRPRIRSVDCVLQPWWSKQRCRLRKSNRMSSLNLQSLLMRAKAVMMWDRGTLLAVMLILNSTVAIRDAILACLSRIIPSICQTSVAQFLIVWHQQILGKWITLCWGLQNQTNTTMTLSWWTLSLNRPFWRSMSARWRLSESRERRLLWQGATSMWIGGETLELLSKHRTTLRPSATAQMTSLWPDATRWAA